ncbi:MAG: hypothetical protein ACKO8Z_05135 [Prosthecobacter sp.]
MDSLRHNAGVAERFDAFCVQAFSKPDWAVPASAFISELFEDHEERLAELARVPDLIIELSNGQAAIVCTVASKWATRGETHRLVRLAESIVAAQGTMKNSAAVEVMLALAATLAVTRPSKAEQLFNAAVPLASSEHADTIADARLWLAAGKVLASAPQEVRDLWDTRIRRPRTGWKWESEEERRALLFLAEQLTLEMDTGSVFSKVVPDCWWELAMKRLQDEQLWQKKLEMLKPSGSSFQEPTLDPPSAPTPATPRPKSQSNAFDDKGVLAVRPQASSVARFALGWAMGVFLTGGTFFLAPEGVYRAIKDLRDLFGTTSSLKSVAPIDGQAWRKAQVVSFSKGKDSLAPLVQKVKEGSWAQSQMLLSGHDPELPFEDERYLQLLVWLHLDPPSDPETRQHLPRLLIDKADTRAISVWEELVYPDSPNADDIRATARSVYKEKASVWPPEILTRLQSIGEAPAISHKP